MTERLQKSVKNRMLFGVCGGLAEYFRTDATIMRLLFVIAGVFWGIGVFLYLLMAVLMPDEARARTEPIEGAAKEPSALDDAAERVRSALAGEGERRRELAALILIGLGGVLILSNLGVFRLIPWDLTWPLLLIALGVFLLLQRARG